MIDVRRQAYLEAMGVDVWVARPPEPERDRLSLGSGQGATLLVCPAAEDAVSPLAGDIARAMGNDPVWSWPDLQGDAAGMRLGEAVDQRLFTQLIIFGEGLARQLLGSEVPGVLGSAAVHVCPGLDGLAVRGSAKKQLWQLIQRCHDGAGRA